MKTTKKLIVSSALLLFVSVTGNAQSIAKVECQSDSQVNNVEELVMRLDGNRAHIQLLKFRHHQSPTEVAVNVTLTENSLSSWPFYRYKFPRDSQPDATGYYYSVEINKNLIDSRYTGTLPKYKFRFLVSDDDMHVSDVTPAPGECAISWD